MGTGSGPRSEGFSHMALMGLPCAPRYVRPLRWPLRPVSAEEAEVSYSPDLPSCWALYP